jgi:hypothetical protein
LSAQRRAESPKAIRQKAKMRDAQETFWQHMQKEAAQEIRCGQCHLALFAAASMIVAAKSGRS